ncbi:MAG: DEAD/DEAH box helicase domain protein [Candidatus Woesebacteria bacterium GW2011_GWF2_46_8]|uniref:DEAD/DEAH box helicase domain protein n=2 Tax=Candidatus Woeseibacteriota TaxID=1752722 RepID=A0A0G1QQM6_9BACT|nr:MAG: DEAD/DEAH box helicase domain protein [Candidatus Woesebacteria bacterium GW2011_GWF2_46_8]
MYRGFNHRSNGHSGGRRFPNRFPSRNQKTDAEIVRAIQAVQIMEAQEGDAPQSTYSPKNRFEDFAISAQLKKNIADKRYLAPTPIQDQVIPAILEGSDIIGIANTGTGKTAAFLIPLIEKGYKDRGQKVLIITPTRELALQIGEELYGFSYGLGINKALCIGGMNEKKQRYELSSNPNFVIGTPGRLREFIQDGALAISKFNNIVIDEADRMVDIGFIADIKYFISRLPQARQSLFFSATIPPKVKLILGSFVRNPITISVKVKESIENIKQDIIKVTDSQGKVDQLENILSQEGFNKVLIFGRTKWGVQKLSNELARRGFRAGAIHGNKSQNQRQRVLNDFKNSRISILLATDVASRGLDIEDVSHVINYDLPNTFEDYIHRIGRTGRANKKGVALTFV